GLGLHGRIPPGVQDEDMLGGREIQAETARLQAHQEQPALGIRLEPRDTRLAITGGPIEILVADALRLEAAPHDGEEARELGEDQRLVALLEDLAEPR